MKYMINYKAPKDITSLVVGADLHIASTHAVATWEELQDKIEKCKREKKLLVLVGDIIDIVNCPKKELNLWRERQAWLMFEESINPYLVWVYGNHSNLVTDIFYVKIGKVFFFHGHTIKDSMEKIREDQNREGGKGKFSRFYYKYYRKIVKRGTKPSKYKKPDAETISRICDLLEESKCLVSVHGHSHAYCDEDIYSGYREINSPRGFKEYPDLLEHLH